MPIPYLPNELVDQILSYECLTQEDLAETCLVSKSWLEPSRKSLYRDIWFGLCVVEASQDNPYTPRPTTYLDIWSSNLLSLLTLRPELARLVKKIHFCIRRHDCLQDASTLSTTLPDLLCSLLRLLPSATYVCFSDNEWFEPDNIGPLFPYFHQLQAVELDESSGIRWFEFVSQLPNLQTLELMWVDTEDLVPSSSTLAPGIAGLHQLTLRHCGPDALANYRLDPGPPSFP